MSKEVCIALVGNRGRMGNALQTRWLAAGFCVEGVDQPLENAQLDQLCSKAQVVLLCVPIPAFVSVLQRLRPHLHSAQILADIASVKLQAMQHMQAVAKGPVVGTHPLFGPDMTGALQVALCPGSNADAGHCAFMERLFAAIGCTSFISSAEEHDRAVASIQGLNFVTSAAYFAALAEHEELLPFLTPSFKRRMEAARSMLTSDGQLFESLFEANPASQEAVRNYRAFLNLAAGGDLSLLRERAAWWWKEKPCKP